MWQAGLWKPHEKNSDTTSSTQIKIQTWYEEIKTRNVAARFYGLTPWSNHSWEIITELPIKFHTIYKTQRFITMFRTALNCTSILHSDISSDFQTTISYVFHTSPMYVTCSTYLTLLSLITLTFAAEYKYET